MAAALIRLAKLVRLSQFRKHPRGPKKPPPKEFNKKHRKSYLDGKPCWTNGRSVRVVLDTSKALVF